MLLIGIIMGIFTSLSLYMAFLAWQTGESSAYFFAASGLFCGIFFFLFLLKFFSRRREWAKKVEGKISGEPGPVSFVPHWFLLAAMAVAALAILMTVLMRVFFR